MGCARAFSYSNDVQDPWRLAVGHARGRAGKPRRPAVALLLVLAPASRTWSFLHSPLCSLPHSLASPGALADSTTALRLMHTLRSLASGGRTIVTSIHQPSSRLYKQMDKVGVRGGRGMVACVDGVKDRAVVVPWMQHCRAGGAAGL